MGIKICRKTREMGILSASSKLEDYIEINYITYIYIFFTLIKKNSDYYFHFYYVRSGDIFSLIVAWHVGVPNI